ncbi:nucleotide exchange factor SIL1-like isoform X2 [Hylaeus volcanicus]|uniref:nucleotide exchange factor SIL1-like isoform X2 n=1 Tax=Hylaeus volcanicus TaxID=313075 RepID=UPI0023B84D73|nr:nucleotide exchange factor SIL1-like isoform X2 [Hylaeus volcanicus]
MSEGAVDWPGLLKWSLKYTDSTRAKNLKSLSKEDVEFIETAIKESGATIDPSKLIEEAVQHFTNDSLTETDKITALVTIKDCVDDFPEVSRHLDSLQVLPILLKAIQMNHEEIRNVGYHILSFSLSNNEKIQIEFWKAGGLIELLKDREALLTNPLNLSALSSLIRQVKNIEEDFLKLGGFEIISTGIQSPNSKIQIKAANIFKHLAIDELCTIKEILQAKIPEAFAFMIKNISNTFDSIQLGESCCFAVQELLQCLTNVSSCEAEQLEEVKERNRALELLKESIHYRFKNIDPQDQSYEQEKKVWLNLLYSLQKQQHFN